MSTQTQKETINALKKIKKKRVDTLTKKNTQSLKKVYSTEKLHGILIKLQSKS